MCGRVERYLKMLMPRFEQRGFRQYFVCTLNYDKSKYQDIVDGIEQIDIRQTFSPMQVVKEIRSIRKIIKHRHPNIVYCHSSFARGQGRMAAAGLPCKVVFYPHG